MKTRPATTGPPSAATRLLTTALTVLAILPSTTHTHQQNPFFPVETAAASSLPGANAAALLRRQASCLAGTYSCATLGALFSNICCTNGQACTTDVLGSPACCPTGAVCTGTAPTSFVTPTATGTTTSYVVSYVSNTYFSFPYVPTSFANGAACSSAVSQCSANYAACTAELGGGATTVVGGGYGVTIVVPGATTIVGGTATSLGTASATSICSSLSSVACGGGALQYSVCAVTGTTESGGFYVGTATGNAGARRTAPACVGLVGVVAAGVAGLGAL